MDQEHYFIHLTFQEFFEARYLSKCFKKNKRIPFLDINRNLADRTFHEFFISNKYEATYEVVWPFLAGLIRDNQALSKCFFELLLGDEEEYKFSSIIILLILCYEEGCVDVELGNKIIDRIIKYCQFYLDNEIFEYTNPVFDYFNRSSKVCLHPKFQSFLIGVFNKNPYTLNHKSYNFLTSIVYLGNSMHQELFNFLINPDNCPDYDEYNPSPDDEPFKWSTSISLLCNDKRKLEFIELYISKMLQNKYVVQTAAMDILTTIDEPSRYLNAYIINKQGGVYPERLFSLTNYLSVEAMNKLKNDLEKKIKEMAEKYQANST